MLTPLQIRNQEFSHVFRGVSEEEVRNFLGELSRQWEDTVNENRRHEERIKELEAKLEHYLRIEEALQEAVHSARENARRTQETAEQRAKLVIEEAEMRAQQLVQDAEHERYLAKQDLSKVNNRQSEIAARLRAFLMSELEILAAFTGEGPSYLPRAERRALPVSGSDLVGGSAADDAEEVELPQPEPSRTDASRTEPSRSEASTYERPPAPREPRRPAEDAPASQAQEGTKRTTVDFRSLFASPEPSRSTPPGAGSGGGGSVQDASGQRESELEKAKIRRILEDLD